MPIYVRFPRINGYEPKYSLSDIKLSYEEWDDSSHLPKDVILRGIVEMELSRIKDKIREYQFGKIEITKDVLRGIVSGEHLSDPQEESFYDFYDAYLKNSERNHRMRQSTLRTHITTINALIAFRPRLLVKDINEDLIIEFCRFLELRGQQAGKGLVRGSIVNRKKHLRTIIRYIESLGIPIANPFRTKSIMVEQAPRNKVYLTLEELRLLRRQLKRCPLKSTERRVLTMFLFACGSGIRIGDVKDLKWHSLDLDKDYAVINYTAKKTNECVQLPLTRLSQGMIQFAPEGDINNVELEKNIFPYRISNTTINMTLKKTANKVGIKKNITFHAARRTFATLCRINNVPMYVIQKCMGHTSSRMTERYVQWDSYLAKQNHSYFDFW